MSPEDSYIEVLAGAIVRYEEWRGRMAQLKQDVKYRSRRFKGKIVISEGLEELQEAEEVMDTILD
jgi:hypothetical protein